jgi:predicted RNase H-like HicB family nuclease
MLRIESERESDGRWLAEVPSLPGVLSYGATDTEARSKATALALRVIAERVERGETLPVELAGMFQLA